MENRSNGIQSTRNIRLLCRVIYTKNKALHFISILFFYSWCEPCKKLEPILVEKAKALGSKCKLVKLNIDTNP